MATENFLNKPMLEFFWTQIKARMVLAEAGKSLSSNDFTNTLKAQLEALTDNDAGYQTGAQVAAAITQAVSQALSGVLSEEEIRQMIDESLAGFDHEIFVVIDELPDPGEANPNKIYLVPNGDEVEIYTLVNGAWKRNGSSSVNLEGYWNEDSLAPMTEAEILEILNAE